MNIPDNILKQKLRNVYFIWGGSCAGKTTSATELQRKHGYYLYSRTTPDLSESEKQEKIKNAYALFPADVKAEKNTPREVIEYAIKHIVCDETTTIEEMVNMIDDYFEFPKNEKIAL